MFALDPTAYEQELLLYVNRMRTDPQAEYDRLIETTTPLKARDSDVNAALQYFQVDGALLRSQWNSLTPVPPLAWHESLLNAARLHNNAMIAQETQSHQLPGEPNPGQRLTNAGYVWNGYGENVFAYAESPLYAHAGFAIDWGSGTGGIQSPPGHRNNIMSAAHREAGVAVTPVTDPTSDVGPLVVTQDFASRSNIGNAFVVGAVWSDDNNSNWYEAGEGKGGVTIEFTRSGSSPVRVTSMTAGGFQVQLANGTWSAKAFGGSLPGEITAGNVVVAGANVMVNFVVPDGEAPIASDDRAMTVQDVAVNIPVRSNDVDADGDLALATIEVLASPAGSEIAIDQAAGTIAFTPQGNFTGEAEIQYRLRDAQGFFSNAATVKIAVTDGTLRWRNPAVYVDVDYDGIVVPLDALLIITQLNFQGIQSLATKTPDPHVIRFWDVSGDNFLTPLDALNVIIYLNSQGGSQPEPIAVPKGSEASIVHHAALQSLAVWWWLDAEEE